jgi:hypothetical protein
MLGRRTAAYRLRQCADNPRKRRKKMKTIVVKWVPDDGEYGKEMRVIESDHLRFIKGSRFDFGFFKIATDEGYAIISLPY